VRWAHGPRGTSRTCRAEAPGLRPGTVPRRRPAEGIERGLAVATCRPSIPLLAISSVVKVLFGRDGPDPLGKSAHLTRRGAGSRTPSSAGLEAARLPVPRPSLCSRMGRRRREPKEPPPKRRLRRGRRTCERPVQTPIRASTERTSLLADWRTTVAAAGSSMARNGMKACRPSVHRWFRSHVASS